MSYLFGESQTGLNAFTSVRISLSERLLQPAGFVHIVVSSFCHIATPSLYRFAYFISVSLRVCNSDFRKGYFGEKFFVPERKFCVI